MMLFRSINWNRIKQSYCDSLLFTLKLPKVFSAKSSNQILAWFIKSIGKAYFLFIQRSESNKNIYLYRCWKLYYWKDTKPIETRGYEGLIVNSVVQIISRKSLFYIGFMVLRRRGYEPRGRGFNSCQPHHLTQGPSWKTGPFLIFSDFKFISCRSLIVWIWAL